MARRAERSSSGRRSRRTARQESRPTARRAGARGVAVLAVLAAAMGLGGMSSGLTPMADAASVVPVTVPTVHGPTLTSAAFGGPGPTDYPYAQGGGVAGLDPYGFVRGQCTSFVAWWLNTHGVPFAVLTKGPAGVGTFLNASGWDSSARAAGFEVGDRPVVGAIAQWHSGERSERLDATGGSATLSAGTPGHVAVVTGVFPDGQAQWVEYGWAGTEVIHVGFGHAPRYLYIGVTPPG